MLFRSPDFLRSLTSKSLTYGANHDYFVISKPRHLCFVILQTGEYFNGRLVIDLFFFPSFRLASCLFCSVGDSSSSFSDRRNSKRAGTPLIPLRLPLVSCRSPFFFRFRLFSPRRLLLTCFLYLWITRVHCNTSRHIRSWALRRFEID